MNISKETYSSTPTEQTKAGVVVVDWKIVMFDMGNKENNTLWL
jgi:hypothetical protein